ncbi:hypothetical protein RSSM_04361 [Rhodopirellula sallentina SM41]|uniref:Uncharacterized protein n=1 Tax=Rhodopirellula sallentina SM41 TaxID=1263870 RepID=M5TYX2_9BACT|nr:hypothetical protein RSSM_04361 [Rhodopirellula sallentina SM41]
MRSLGRKLIRRRFALLFCPRWGFEVSRVPKETADACLDASTVSLNWMDISRSA